MNAPLPLPAPTAIGLPFEGGLYAGCINVGAELFAIIVAPKAEGETQGKWQHTATDLAGAVSYFDGLANTDAMALWASPIALWAKTLQINGFTDWYIPSRDELELLYRAFKPTAESNYVYRSGDNPSSVPPGYPYTAAEPAQASVPTFKEGGAEAFEAEWYWSSTQGSRHGAWFQYFDDGYQNIFDESYGGRARAVRRFKVQ